MVMFLNIEIVAHLELQSRLEVRGSAQITLCTSDFTLQIHRRMPFHFVELYRVACLPAHLSTKHPR